MPAFENGSLVETTEFPHQQIDADLGWNDAEERPSASQIANARAEGAAVAASYIADSHRPRLQAHQILSACGLLNRLDLSDTDLARAHAISKQAFQQGKKRFLAMLGGELRKTRTMKRPTDKYSLCNFRNEKPWRA